MTNGSVRKLIANGLVTLGEAIALSIELMTGSASPSNDEFKDKNMSGGILNYRTGNLDDGTDPYGWYEHD